MSDAEADSPTVFPVARTVDAAILCVRLGVTNIAVGGPADQRG